MWRGLSVERIVDVLKSHQDKDRFEVRVVIKAKLGGSVPCDQSNPRA